MWNWVATTNRICLRDVIVVLTLLSHAMMTFGVPFPAMTARESKDASRPFPCQFRPCGCIDAEECWKGDCCCFTLEEKLVWADTNNIEPPDHVRPLVASRKTQPSIKKQASCCEEPVDECPTCAAASAQPCCDKERPTDRPAIRWVVGVFVQKCWGDGLAGLFPLEPAVLPDAPLEWFPAISGVCPLPAISSSYPSGAQRPLAPPPRRSPNPSL